MIMGNLSMLILKANLLIELGGKIGSEQKNNNAGEWGAAQSRLLINYRLNTI